MHLLKNLNLVLINQRIGNPVHACKESMREDFNLNKKVNRAQIHNKRRTLRIILKSCMILKVVL